MINHVRENIDPLDRRARKSDDVQNHTFSHSECQSTTESSRQKLDNKVKESQLLLFFKCAVYECTYNKDLKFSQSQICMIINIPSQDDLDHFRKIEVITAPPGMQDVTFDENETQNTYISDGWKLKTLAFLHQEQLKCQMLFKLRGNNMDSNIVSHPQFMQVWAIHSIKLQLKFLMKMNHLNYGIKLK